MTLLEDGHQWLSTWEGLFSPNVLYRGETTSHINNHWGQPSCSINRYECNKTIIKSSHLLCNIKVFFSHLVDSCRTSIDNVTSLGRAWTRTKLNMIVTTFASILFSKFGSCFWPLILQDKHNIHTLSVKLEKQIWEVVEDDNINVTSPLQQNRGCLG
jgi:hypothetical protein